MRIFCVANPLRTSRLKKSFRLSMKSSHLPVEHIHQFDQQNEHNQ